MGPPHALHAEIRKGKTSAFSHWGDYVLFSLPSGIENAAGTQVTVFYSLHTKWPAALVFPALAILLALIFYRPALVSVADATGLLQASHDFRLAGSRLNLGVPDAAPQPLARAGRQQGRETFLFTAGGLIIAAVAWGTGANTNFLYLVYLYCTFAAFYILARTLRTRLVLSIFFLFFLFYTPRVLPALPEVKERFSLAHSTGGLKVPPGETRTYQFPLAPLAERERECGPLEHGDIYIQGDHLTPTLTSDRGSISEQVVAKFQALVTLRGRLRLPGELPRELRVSLHNDQDHEMTIYRGPEHSKSRPYPDAVYLLFNTAKCVLVVHSHNIE
jgi:hypothetical protein